MHIHHISGHMQDMYMAVYPDKLLLLDGGCRCDADMICDYITHTLKRNVSDLKLVVVTHMHPDHAGGAHRLRKITGCNIASANTHKPNTKKHWYSGLSGMTAYMVDQSLSQWMSKRLHKPRKNLFYSPFLKPDYHLNDGDTLPYFPDWQAFDTHGHTDSDLTVYHAATKSAYTADLIVKTKRGYISPFPLHFPDSYRKSLKKVQSLKLERVFLAHGGEVHISDAEFDDFIANKTPNSARTIKDTLRYKLKQYFD